MAASCRHALIDLVPVDRPAGQKGGAAPGREGRNMDHFCLQVEPFDGEAIIAHLKRHGCEPARSSRATARKGRGRRSTCRTRRATWWS